LEEYFQGGIMINEQILKGKWNEIRGEIRSKWGYLNDDELEVVKGDATRLMGLIQQRYGIKKEEIERSLNNMLNRFSQDTDDDQESINP
jgi:uncharacterized protein YjbJ (UPF0337 family)